MKQSFKKLTNTFGNLAAKTIFSVQLSAILLALPLLYMVGVSHNLQDNKMQKVIMTNKGKKIIVTSMQQANKNVNVKGIVG